jgi:hypothetical protein
MLNVSKQCFIAFHLIRPLLTVTSKSGNEATNVGRNWK